MIKSLVDWLSDQEERIDILINSAGIAEATSVFDNEENDKFEILFKLTFLGCGI